MGWYSLHITVPASVHCVSFPHLQGYASKQIRQVAFEKSKRARMLKLYHHIPQYLRGHRCSKAKGERVGPSE
jgi:hypothetical protein